MALPALGNLTKDRNIKVGEPLGRVTYFEKGRHLILGQRERKGSLDSLILIGKCFEHTKTHDKFNANVWLDIAFPHVIFLSGTRGSGKSFDIGVIVEGLALPPSSGICTEHSPVAALVFDLQNQFWTLSRMPDASLPEDADQINLLKEWGLSPASVSTVTLLIPPGDTKLIGNEEELTLAASDLTADDLCSFWNTDIYSPQGHLVSTILEKVAALGYESVHTRATGETTKQQIAPKPQYEIDDLLLCLRTDQEVQSNIAPQVVDAIDWRLHSLQRSNLFRSQGIPVRRLLGPGRVAVLLLRSLDDATKGLVTGLLLRKIYAVMGEYHTRRKVYRRLQKNLPEADLLPERVWCIVDEAHVICPAGNESSATRSMIEYVKQGRDAGLSLVLATQQPSAIDTRVLSQVDLTLVHRLTFDGDISAALARIPAYLPNNFTLGSTQKDPRMMVRLLETGEAIVGDSQADRTFVGIVRPRLTAHGGAEPK